MGWWSEDRKTDWEMLSVLYFQWSSALAWRQCWLWMSQPALLCLLYLVLLTVATIHLYLVADASNHSILPLIYLNPTPLEYSVCPSRHALCWSIYPSVFPSFPLPVCVCIRPTIHPFIHPSIHQIIPLYIHPFMHLYVHHPSVHLAIYQATQSSVNDILLWDIWHIQQSDSDLTCQRVALSKSLSWYF